MKSIDEGIVCIINELLLHHATIKQFKKSDTGYYLQKLNFINTAITEQIKLLGKIANKTKRRQKNGSRCE